MSDTKVVLMNRYWKFDTEAFIADYHTNRSVLDGLKDQIIAFDDASYDTAQISTFSYQNQKTVLRAKILEYKKYVETFESVWSSLTDLEQAILNAFYFQGLPDVAAIEKTLADECQLGSKNIQLQIKIEDQLIKEYKLTRSLIYEKRAKILDKINYFAIRTGVYMMDKYWSFNPARFLKDYHLNIAVLDGLREEKKEMEEGELPDVDPNVPNVQTSMKECAILDRMIHKKMLEVKINEYEIYEKTFKRAWSCLSITERDVINEFFFKDHKSKEAANMAFAKRYAMTRSSIYAIRREALEKIKRCVNG